MTVPEQLPKPRRGCFFYGAIAAVVCLVLLMVVFLVAFQMFKRALNQFTDTKPAPLPRLELTRAQIEQVQRRFDLFQDAVSTGRPTPPLELTGDDLNAVIATRADFQGLTNKLYVRIDGDKLDAQLSIPMEQLGLSMFKGRYLNGQATFAIFLENGLLRIAPDKVTVKGKPLPDIYMQRLRSENLARGVNENSKASIALNRLEKIEVKDGKVIVIPKQEK